MRKVIANNEEHEKYTSFLKFISDVARKFEVAEHVYVVGGAVRNFLINKPIKDIDIVIDSISIGGRKVRDSEWFAKRLADSIPAQTKVITNQYGVAILRVDGEWNLDGHSMKGEVVEIANAREESYGGEVGKGYKPSDIKPSTIEKDIYRREFTFNTLMWRLLDLTDGPEKAEVIDLTGCGIEDLKNKEVRCPRDPDIVFSDDPTRLLRAIKFVSKYGFQIPEDLKDSIIRNSSSLEQAPWEAIGVILADNILSEPTALDAIFLMKELGLLDIIINISKNKKPFSSYLSTKLKDKDISILLALSELGLEVKTPISFLSKEQQDRLKNIIEDMSEEESKLFLLRLRRPPVNNVRMIEEFKIPPTERGSIIQIARDLILNEPEILNDENILEEKIKMELSDIYKKSSSFKKRLIKLSSWLIKNGFEEEGSNVDEITEEDSAELHLYDFDGTLFRSPYQPATWSGDWWGNIQSLTEPCVPEIPGDDWWIGEVVSQARNSISNPNVFSVLATGRSDRSGFRYRVPELLSQQGLSFDSINLSTQADSLDWKVNLILGVLKKYTFIKRVKIWDDRVSHLQRFERELIDFGIPKEDIEINRIGVKSKLPLCGDKTTDSPTTGKKVSYLGIFLDSESRSKIAHEFPFSHNKIKSDHITLTFKPKSDDPRLNLVGQYVDMKVVGYAEDDKIQTLVVEIPEDLRLEEKIYHISLSHDKNTKPAYSNELLKDGWNEIDGPILRGIIDTFPRSNFS